MNAFAGLAHSSASAADSSWRRSIDAAAYPPLQTDPPRDQARGRAAADYEYVLMGIFAAAIASIFDVESETSGGRQA